MHAVCTTVAATALALTASVAAAQPASATPTDIAGDRISWYGSLPCRDGGGVVDVFSRTAYLTPGYGSYRLRVGLYRSSDDGRIALGPLRDVTSNGGVWQGYWDWNTRFSYSGNAYMVAYAYRWNGSSYALTAREWVPCA